MILLAEPGPDGSGWTLELYGDEESRPVEDAAALVEALSSRTLGREVRFTVPAAPEPTGT